MTRCTPTLIVLAATTSLYALSQERPLALRNAETHRATLDKGRVELEIRSTRRESTNPARRYLTCRFAGDDVLSLNRGDADGIVVRSQSGRVDTPDSTRPRGGIKQGEELIFYSQGSVEAESFPVAKGIASPVDARTLGFASWNSWDNLQNTLWRVPGNQPGPARFQEEVVDSLHVVSETTDRGTRQWWIDADKGWSPVRVATFDQNGKMLSESKTTLKQYGDAWYPRTVAFYLGTYKDGLEPVETVEVHSAAFNAPDQPDKLTVADLGIEPGVEITRHTADGRPVEVVLWDGKRIVSREEFDRRLQRGEIEEGPNYVRKMARNAAIYEEHQRNSGILGGRPVRSGGESTNKAPLLSKWEAYVLDFIRRFRLDEGQSNRAKDVLQSCQEQAQKYVASHKAEFDELETRSKAEQSGGSGANDPRTASLQSRRSELLRPVDEIFERQLKPRLEKLPTRAQRQAAEAAAATTKPAAGAAQADAPKP